MLYTKIKASFILAKNRLYRTFLVKPDIDLETLGCVICTGFRATYEHAFMFRVRKLSFVPEEWLDDYFDHYRSMKDSTLEDLGPSFRLIYDTGDNWEFECKVYKRPVEYDSDETAVIIDGAGAGIWEDNVWGFTRYLDGEIPPDTSEDLEEIDWYMPWNLELEQIGDFDHFDPAEEQERLMENLHADVYNIKRYNSDDDLYDPMPAGSIWHSFHSNMKKGVNTPNEIKQQLEEFKHVCGVLKEQGALPEKFTDLIHTGADPVDLNFMVEHMPELIFHTLEKEQALSELIELRDMFIYGPNEYDELTDLIALSYIHLKEYKEAQNEVDTWREKYPDSYLMNARQINLYTMTKRLKDAEALLQKLDIMNMEIDPKNSCIFLAAREFYIAKKNRKKAAWAEEQINLLIERLEEQYDDDFDEDDYDDDDFDEDDYDDDDFDEDDYEEDVMNHTMMEMMRNLIISDAQERFDKYIREYRDKQSKEAEQEILAALARSFFMNREFRLSRNRNGNPKTVRSDGKTWIALYTDRDKAKKDGVQDPDIVSAADMMEYAKDHPHIAGYLIDPEPGYDGYSLPAQTILEKLHELMTHVSHQMAERFGFDPDDHMIDEEDIPF